MLMATSILITSPFFENLPYHFAIDLSNVLHKVVKLVGNSKPLRIGNLCREVLSHLKESAGH